MSKKEKIDKMCYTCFYFRRLSKTSPNGWCKDDREGRKSIRVIVLDSCDYWKPKQTTKVIG
jgi:hypothetical protein